MADLARLGRVSRARITQIMDLLMRAPGIQEEVLSKPSSALGFADVHRTSLKTLWQDQRGLRRRRCTGE